MSSSPALPPAARIPVSLPYRPGRRRVRVRVRTAGKLLRGGMEVEGEMSRYVCFYGGAFPLS